MEALAYAQVRLDDIRKDSPSCSPGHKWTIKRPIAGRVWDSCPQCLLVANSGFWSQVVERYVASTVSPLAGWPEAYTMGAYMGLIALKGAIQADEARQIKEAREGPEKGPPRSSKRSKTE